MTHAKDTTIRHENELSRKRHLTGTVTSEYGTQGGNGTGRYGAVLWVRSGTERYGRPQVWDAYGTRRERNSWVNIQFLASVGSTTVCGSGHGEHSRRDTSELFTTYRAQHCLIMLLPSFLALSPLFPRTVEQLNKARMKCPPARLLRPSPDLVVST